MAVRSVRKFDLLNDRAENCDLLAKARPSKALTTAKKSPRPLSNAELLKLAVRNRPPQIPKQSTGFLRWIDPPLRPARRSRNHLSSSQPSFLSFALHVGKKGVEVIVVLRHHGLARAVNFRNDGIIVRRRGRVTTLKVKPYVYRGLLQCGECGAAITMETQKGHNYLRCTKRMAVWSQRYLREEKLTQQIAAILEQVSLPDDTAEWMVSELHCQREHESGASHAVRKTTRTEIENLDSQIGRLTAAYLDQAAFTPEEFRKTKNKLVNARQEATEKLKKLEADDVARFEPIIRFINRSKQGKYVASRAEPKELRSELEKTGSNRRLQNRKTGMAATRSVETRCGTRLYGPSAHRAVAGRRGV